MGRGGGLEMEERSIRRNALEEKDNLVAGEI